MPKNLFIDPLDKMHEECGVAAVFGHPDAARLTYLMLYALQHRGQESAGIVSSNGSGFHVKTAMGLVADIFDKPTLEGLTGKHAIGHVRYSTAGGSNLQNVQPIVANTGNPFTRRGLAAIVYGCLTTKKENQDVFRVRTLDQKRGCDHIGNILCGQDFLRSFYLSPALHAARWPTYKCVTK